MLAGGVTAIGVELASGVVALSVAGTQVWPKKAIAITTPADILYGM